MDQPSTFVFPHGAYSGLAPMTAIEAKLKEAALTSGVVAHRRLFGVIVEAIEVFGRAKMAHGTDSWLAEVLETEQDTFAYQVRQVAAYTGAGDLEDHLAKLPVYEDRMGHESFSLTLS